MTSSGHIKSYIAYAERVLNDPEVGLVRFVANGKTLNKLVSVAEILKRKRTGLHQVSELCADGTDENGRVTPLLSITLSPLQVKLDVLHPGYKAPE